MLLLAPAPGWAADPAAGPSEIRLTWLGTAGFLIEWGGARFAVDPYISRHPEAKPVINTRIEDLLPLDAILITHGHFDHAADVEAIARAAACPVYAPRTVTRKLEITGYPPELLHPNETTPGFRIGEVSVHVVSSRHIRFNPALVATIAGRVIRSFRTLDVLRLGLGHPLGSNSDFLASYGGVSVYLSGSAGFGEETLRGLHADVALLPYAGRSDMLPVFGLALKMLQPAVLVPQHFDEFYPGFAPLGDLETLREFLGREYPQIKMVIPPPGVPFTINLEK
jgi:L-ascorbate metabolism protein UlaG (beta-lactamase superfamily)